MLSEMPTEADPEPESEAISKGSNWVTYWRDEISIDALDKNDWLDDAENPAVLEGAFKD